jgi:glycosyltransferase involved in cell wall biosynthesis
MRGGERVIESLCTLFPDADIFTHVYDPRAISPAIRKHNIKTTFIDKLPTARKYYKYYLPLMPVALEQLDLRGYDLIISSESGPAKGIVPPAGAIHICYCHSPMRYIWNMYHDYKERAGLIQKLAMPPMTHYLRSWDAVASMRVDHFVANSETVAARIKKYYRREASVIHPPVDTDSFYACSEDEIEDYYLLAGELVPYKRPDLAVEAFNAMGRRLVIIGGGEMLASIKKIAGSTITVLGAQPTEVLKHYYSRCRALVFPGEEDFGMVPVEAMASGRPVIAFRRGGATETVDEKISGLFFDEQSSAAIAIAVARFEHMTFDSDRIQKHARKFHTDRFISEFRSLLRDAAGDRFC